MNPRDRSELAADGNIEAAEAEIDYAGKIFAFYAFAYAYLSCMLALSFIATYYDYVSDTVIEPNLRRETSL